MDGVRAVSADAAREAAHLEIERSLHDLEFSAALCVDPSLAAFHADSQMPCGVAALDGAITHPAWNGKRSWYVLTTDDKMIPPAAQHAMSKRAGATVIEVKASHSVYESQPNAVASVIEQASREAR